MKVESQLSLFDTDRNADAQQTVAARERMRGMIDRLKAASVPWWQKEMEVIFDEGAFQRAVRLVPPEEAQALRVEFDAEMERLYAIWAADFDARAEAAPG